MLQTKKVKPIFEVLRSIKKKTILLCFLTCNILLLILYDRYRKIIYVILFITWCIDENTPWVTRFLLRCILYHSFISTIHFKINIFLMEVTSQQSLSKFFAEKPILLQFTTNKISGAIRGTTDGASPPPYYLSSLTQIFKFVWIENFYSFVQINVFKTISNYYK